VVDLYARMALKMDVSWHAQLPAGPKIIAANHPTTTDPFLMLSWVPEQMSILVTEACFNVPIFGQFLRQAGQVPVARSNGRAAFDRARELLASGRTVAIFPEGSLSPLEGGLCRPRTGVARLALSTGAPVIPVGIHLQRERIRFVDIEIDDRVESARWYLDGPYAVTVGKPMYLDGSVEDRPHVRHLSRQVMERIALLSQESALRMAQQGRSTVRTARPLETGRATGGA
jgi:1-acyl-sn-glycerol-3-phosphate acyltransferase